MADIRPMNFGEILDGSLMIYRRHFGLFLQLALAALGVPAAVLAVPLKGSGPGLLFVVALVCAGMWFTVFVACGYGVTTPVVVLEELGSSFDAFGRSWELTRSFKLKVLGLAFVAFLLCNVLPSQVLQAVAQALQGSAPAAAMVLTVFAVVLPLILAPVIAAVVTLIYYDLRVRREAFDLQVLGQRLGII